MKLKVWLPEGPMLTRNEKLLQKAILYLALLDCVSRAHEICFRPSSVRPSVASIISEPLIAFKFWFLLSLGHMPRRVLNF